MASAVDLQQPGPAGSLSSRFPAYDVSSPSLVNALAGSPKHPYPQYPDHLPSPSLLSYDSFGTSTTIESSSQPAPTRSKASHAKLHKRAGSKSSLKGRKSEQSERSAIFLARTDTPPMIAEIPYAPPRKPRNKLKENVRRLAAREEQDSTDIVDLNKTAAENEERSGLGISSPHIKTANNVDFTRNVRHGRSFSHNSSSSLGASFKPSAPFLHPINKVRQPSPEQLPADSHANSFTSNYSSTFPHSSEAGRNRTVSSVSSVRRPSLHLHTSDSSGRITLASRSIDNIPDPTIVGKRSRRGTMQSTETTTPISRSSLEYAFSARRNESMDEMSRQASIRAARIAFAEREEAKARRYEEQQRKSAERDTRRAMKREEKRRQRDPVASRQDDTAEANLPSEKQPHARGEATPTPLRKEPVLKQSAGRSELPSVYTKDPPISRKRRAKSIYLAFFLWLKAKLFNMRRDR